MSKKYDYITMKVKPDIHSKFMQLCKNEGRNVSEMINILVERRNLDILESFESLFEKLEKKRKELFGEQYKKSKEEK